MSISKIDKIERIDVVGDFKILEIKTVSILSEDGQEISRYNTRKTISPICNHSNESTDIKNLCDLFHTDTLKIDYRNYLDSLGV